MLSQASARYAAFYHTNAHSYEIITENIDTRTHPVILTQLDEESALADTCQLHKWHSKKSMKMAAVFIFIFIRSSKLGKKHLIAAQLVPWRK